nr:ABC transporter ATP-binding protein [Marinithermus hydrothermalis]
MLEVENLTVRYGAVEAVRNVSFYVEEGEVVTLIGPNGAGKTTTLMALAGLLPAEGRATYRGRPALGRTTEALAADGLVLVPERRELFAELTVEDNLLLGAFTRYRRGERNLKASLEHVYGLFPRLAERRRQLAGTMSGGEQQMLAIGRALMAKPRLLMLDEPSLGLAPLIVQEIFRTLAQLKQHGTTILLVEQNAKAALALADRGYVLETGEIQLSGPAGELAQDPRVLESYLGLRAGGEA